MRTPIPLSIAVVALGLAACAERALGPADVSGSYSLIGYDGAVPPVSYPAPGGCTVTVSGGSLFLGADGSYSLYVERARRCPGPAGLEWVGVRMGGGFRLSGLQLQFADGSGAGTGLVGALVGTHIRVSVPQPSGLSPSVVTVEFAGGATSETVAGEGGNAGPPPLPDTGTVVITIRP